MLTCQHFSLRVVSAFFLVFTFVLASSELAFAQDEKRSSGLASVVKGVVFDPTTYAPAALGYDATMKDWNTSQPFFQNGFVEHNARFTVTGQSDATALPYTTGKNQIVKGAVSALGMSVVQNTTSRLVERALLERFPDHRKVVKTIGWIERISVASIMSYHYSAAHYRQAQINAQRATDLGLR